ncbi:CatA-like O-acetyltransferase [Lutibacter sp.]|uniref:CatA-like O-acetyltransferase n=1 Tax=Lutibacter sp. TaxID=1925666 RepID=UPI003567F3BC
MKEFDVENWNRKAQYQFFKTYADPFFNITANLEVANLYKYCKQHHLSFSLACLYVALKSANDITEFKLRFKNDKIYLFDNVNIGATVLNDDLTFSFCDFEFQKTMSEFDIKGKIVLENHKNGIVFNVQDNNLGIIHCSTIPWVSFTGFKHARKGNEGLQGIPKLVFGKLFTENEIQKIPFSVEVHHALMDGYHVGLLYKKIQQFIDELI